MVPFIFRRVLQGIVVLILVSLLVFLAMHLMSGDPLMLYLGERNLGNLPEDQIQVLREQFGLDKPLPLQYVFWIGGILRGDFGTSIYYHEDVGILIAERLPITMHLGILAIIFGAFIGIAVGVISAIRWGKWTDVLVTTLANIGITIPVFWLGILLIYYFGFQLKWLPMSGYTSPFDDFWLSFKQAILPVICLSIAPLAATARQTRSSVLEVIRQDYIRTAWAKGLAERDVLIRHALKNALIPVVTLIGMWVRVIIGGAVLTETVFNIPGMGRLMASSVFGRDFQVVQSGVLIISAIVVLANLLVDIAYGWFDPRIRYDE